MTVRLMLGSVRGLAQQARLMAGDVLNHLRATRPAARRLARENMILRRNGARLLDGFSRQGATPAYGRVLVDGMWDNPNFWTRYALLRASLGLESAHEMGLLGPFNRERVRAVFEEMGIAASYDFRLSSRDKRAQNERARDMAAAISSSDDAMDLAWPHNFPAQIAYDGIIRRQRRGNVDPTDPHLPDYLAEALACIERADRVLAEARPRLLVLSHAINFDFAALAWIALQRSIDVIVAYGNYGANRFLRVDSSDALYDFSNVPRRDQFDSMEPATFEQMRIRGRHHLAERLNGATDDLGAVYAFQRTRAAAGREQIVRQMGLDADKPLVCVYASNWFDFPHGAHMCHFRDFRDWIDATLVAAIANQDVNWLFRPHPCDAWYGGVNGPTLADLVAKNPASNVRLVASDWNGQDLMRAVDAGITYFGTVAIEMVASGKPALLADVGWYGHLDLARLPESRAHYLELLGQRWWDEVDLERAQARTEAFAGWWFAMPDWLEPARMRDDSQQEDIWNTLPTWLEAGASAIAREVATIGDWVHSGGRHLHVFRWQNELQYLSEPERELGRTR